jgi:formylglycine-generating enzyme required for sulfatase activity
MAVIASEMPDQRTIRIFISSPADVRPERLKAEQIVARLDREFAYRFHVEAVLWEREPLVATHHFQDERNIPEPRGMDVVVVILWSRLGVPLPEDKFRGALSKRPVTGTEWEFEDALASARERGVPELLLYRKQAPPTAALHDRKALEERLAQLDLVEDFIGRWFRAEDGGQGLTAASHSFATATEFEEKLYDHLRELLERRAGGRAEGIEIRWHQPPFRALLSYEYEDAPIFFGRTHARNELRELLARQIDRGLAFVLVFGASGSGKSSLVKAGLVPDLTLPGMIGRVGLVRRAVMLPSNGRDPLAALAAALLSPTALPELAELQYTPERLAALLREAPGQAALPIEQGLAAAGKSANLAATAVASLVLVVDQLEEIFTIDALAHETREAFVAALTALSKSGFVWVVATMRSDFFDRLETSAGLSLARLGVNEARYQLLPPHGAEIGQIIRQPASEAGLRFEHDAAGGLSLDEAIRRVAAGDRSALPLLSFLLDQLWQKRSETGFLTFAAYQELGGLEGAIGRRAEEVFQAQPEAVQRELVLLLRALVTVRGATATARTAPLSLFPAGTPRRSLVDALLDPEARLLVSDSDSGQAQLRLAHEALLTHWPRAKEQVEADARDLELRGRLEEEAEQWRVAETRQEKRGRIVAGFRLGEARALLARWGSELSTEIKEFITASRRAARWRQLRLWGLVAAAPPAVTLVALVVWAGQVWWGVRQVEAELRFVPIAAGCFEMGSPDSERERYPDEGPVHKVCVKPFDLGQYEMTQSAWRKVMIFPNTAEPSRFNGENLPVESVSWNEAQRFVWLMSLFGRGHYRLPSEAEYEYAARAGTTTSRYWGDNIDDGCAHENIADQSLKKTAPTVVPVFANCDDGYASTAPVGSFKPNPWGLYDMLGNITSWVEDCYVDSYGSTPIDGSPNTMAACATRVVRGSSYIYGPQIVRTAYRSNSKPDFRNSNIGFRLARTVTP